MGDNHDVTGAIPVIQTKIDRFDHATVPWRGTILRRSLAEVRILSVVLLHTSPSGTVLDSKSGEAVFDSLATCFARTPRSGPPCGVTAAGGISGLETRRTSPTCSPVARALGSDPRDRWCKSSHVDQVSSLSSRAEHLADNREMKVQVLQGGLMVVESEVVEERGREPRPSGCESHRPPHRER